MLHSFRLIITLFKKDILLEFRQQYSFYGVLLYVASTIFVLYMAMGQPENRVWNGLFWMMQLFICVNAVAKTFLQEGKGRQLYFYSLCSPVHFMLARMIFNAALMLLMNLISLLLFILLLGSPLAHPYVFLGISCFGACSISLVFSFLAAIAARAQQNAALMAILGFPLIIPQLMLMMRLSTLAFSDVFQSGLVSIVLLLACFDIMVVLLSVILFPFLWKD
ncbi:MAG TPA: cytochrome C biogenesis protein [Chitinophagaceae bacterium]|jgi:heme exporter protein B|nr:cytochrome C biogenesis protein [Chitinophagaceae bacterium]